MKKLAFLLTNWVLVSVAQSADDIAPLSDEFDNAATMANWQRLNDTEGWNADKLEVHDLDVSRAGHMRLVPHTTVWFMDMTGPLVYKEITGDFAVTMQIEVSRKNGEAGRPTRAFSVAGIMLRKPRVITSAGPSPDAAAATVLPWPPSGYTTDWTPDEESYLYLSIGSGNSGAADQWNYEAKSTIDGNSVFYSDNRGFPANSGVATLQIVRRGSTFLLLRKHEGTGWIIENRYERPDLPATLQVGMTAYGDWPNITGNGLYSGPADHDGQYHHNHNVISAANGFSSNTDLVADIDYLRFSRLPDGLSQADLQGVAVTESSPNPVFLSATALSDVLGDPLGQAYDPEEPEDPNDPPKTKPDLSVGKSAGSQRGVGVVNSSGGGQKWNAKSKRRKKVRGISVVRNIGDAAGAIRLRATKGNRKFRVKYFGLSPVRRNVTGVITGAGVLTDDLGNGEQEMFQIEVKPKRKGRKTLRITGTADGGLDGVRVKVRAVRR